MSTSILESNKYVFKAGDLIAANDEFNLWCEEALEDTEALGYREFNVGDIAVVVDIIEQEYSSGVKYVYYIIMTPDGSRWICEYDSTIKDLIIGDWKILHSSV